MAANEGSTGVKMVKVPEDRDGQRLDNFLLLQFKGAPRSLIYKLVRSGQVRINGKRAKPDSRLAGGDEVRLPPVKLNEPGEVRPTPQGLLDRLAASIVFEDKALLAVNKPTIEFPELFARQFDRLLLTTHRTPNRNSIPSHPATQSR